MGLFDMFTKEGKLKTAIRRMSEPYALAEDRDAAVRLLDEDGSARALAGLLTRFDLQISSQLKDQDEKEQVYRVLVSHGAVAVAQPLREWLRKCRQYAWPLKLLAELEGLDAAANMVYELLAGEAGRAAFEPERRKHLLVWLADHRVEGAIAAATPFLSDFDEEVRYAAAEVIVSQESEDGRVALLGALDNPREESNRLRHRLAVVFRQRGWTVGELKAPLPDGFALHDGRVVTV